MAIRYSDDFKREVTRAYKAGNRSTVQIAADYNIAKSSVSEWAKKYGEECQYKNTTAKIDEGEPVAEIRRLNKELKEKEIEFLKKAAAFFAREID